MITEAACIAPFHPSVQFLIVSIEPSLHLSIHPNIYPFIQPSIYHCNHLSIHPSVPCPFHLRIHPSIHPASILPVIHAIAVCVGQSCTDDSDFKDVPGKSSAGGGDGRVGVGVLWFVHTCDAAHFVQACRGIVCLYRVALALWNEPTKQMPAIRHRQWKEH